MKHLLLVLLVVSLGSCTKSEFDAYNHGKERTTPIEAADAGKKITDADKKLEEADDEVNKTTLPLAKKTGSPELVSSVVKVQGKVEDARTDLKDGKESADAATVKAGADQKELERFRAADPVRKALRWCAFTLYAIAALSFLLGVLALLPWGPFTLISKFILHPENLFWAAGAALLLGGLFGAIARWEVVIELVIAAVACAVLFTLAIFLLVKLLRHRYATDQIVKSVTAGVVSGATIWTEQSSEIANNIQGSLAKRIVDKGQTVIAKAKEEFHHWSSFHLAGSPMDSGYIHPTAFTGGPK